MNVIEKLKSTISTGYETLYQIKEQNESLAQSNENMNEQVKDIEKAKNQLTYLNSWFGFLFKQDDSKNDKIKPAPKENKESFDLYKNKNIKDEIDEIQEISNLLSELHMISIEQNKELELSKYLCSSLSQSSDSTRVSIKKLTKQCNRILN